MDRKRGGGSPYPKDPRVDAYIDALPGWQQDICRAVRDLVHAADPAVTETVKYRDRPYFVLNGNICALLAAKDHVEVSQAAGYTVTLEESTMLGTPNVVTLPGYDAGDDEYMQITPPFPLEVYGQTYNVAWLDTNGYLMFEDRGFADPLPFSIPSPEWSPDAAVYPLWGDWVVDSTASVRTGLHGSAPNRQWVLEWRDVHPFNMWQRVSFQIVFYESTGQISLAYENVGPTFVERGGAGLTGVENADGTSAVQFSYLTPVLRTGRGAVFTPTS